MIDQKEWIQQRADSIATERYGQDFYALDDDSKDLIYAQASEDYKDWFSSYLDKVYDQAYEAHILKVHGY